MYVKYSPPELEAPRIRSKTGLHSGPLLSMFSVIDLQVAEKHAENLSPAVQVEVVQRNRQPYYNSRRAKYLLYWREDSTLAGL